MQNIIMMHCVSRMLFDMWGFVICVDNERYIPLFNNENNAVIMPSVIVVCFQKGIPGFLKYNIVESTVSH